MKISCIGIDARIMYETFGSGVPARTSVPDIFIYTSAVGNRMYQYEKGFVYIYGTAAVGVPKYMLHTFL